MCLVSLREMYVCFYAERAIESENYCQKIKHMDANRIKKMLDKYYSGDILPEEYQILISALTEADELIPELEAERRILLAIDSCEPLEPNGFEDRLKMAIDCRSKKKSHIPKNSVFRFGGGYCVCAYSHRTAYS